MTSLTAKKVDKVEMDSCIYCGKETKEPKDKPVYFRPEYIEGAGQLCIDCYMKIYNE